MFKDILKKLRYIFIPSVFMIISSIGIYSFFHWFFILEKEWISLDENILIFTLPIVFILLLIVFWFKTRLRLLNIGDKSDLHLIFLAFYMLILCGNIQNIIRRSHSSLVKIESISEIEHSERSKYYAIEQFDVEPSISNTFTKISDGDDMFYVHLYIITPILPKVDSLKIILRDYWLEQKGTSGINLENLNLGEKRAFFNNENFKEIKYWYAVKFYDSFGYNGKERNQKNIARFVEESKKEFLEFNFYNVEYFEVLKNNSDSRSLQEALDGLGAALPKNSKVLSAVQDTFDERIRANKKWLFWLSTLGTFFWLIIILYPPFDTTALIRFKKGIKKTNDSPISTEKILIPNKDRIVTQLFLFTSILFVFILMFNNIPFFFPSFEDLIPFGSNYSPLVRDGEYWRLITSLFISGGFEYFSYILMFFTFTSIQYEKHIGHLKLLFILLFTGIIGNICACYYFPNGHTFGMSGATLGLGGFLFILELFKNSYLDDNGEKLSSILLKLLLLICIIAGLFNIYSAYNVMNLSSFIAGVVLGFIQYGYNRFVAR